MAEGLSSKNSKELAEAEKIPSGVHLENSVPPNLPGSELTMSELKEKLRAVIVNIDQLAEQAARDSAERSMTASVEQMKGISGFFKRIWTHTAGRELHRQKHVGEARGKIQTEQNIYGAEYEHPVGREAHESTASALVERFTQEYEEMRHEGETRGIINPEGSNGLDIKGEIISLMKRYAAGEIEDDNFNEAKKQVLHTVSRVEGNTKGDSMYADNLFEIAKQIKESEDHKSALESLDSELEVVLGNARSSIQTEAKHNVVDKAIEFAKKTPLGVLVNESTLASGIAIAVGITAGLSKRLASSRLAAWGTFGATAALTGGIIGYAENKRTKEDRSQHAREMAQGRTYEKGASPRREEMDKFTHEMRDARQLASAIREAKSDTDKLNAIADAEARIQLMGREHIDLLSYSDPTKVEQERFDLDMARYQAKAELRKTPAGGKSFDEELNKLIDARNTELIKGEGGIEEKDKCFNKMKMGRVGKAAAKGVLIGLAVGTVAQEAAAFFNDEQTGLVEHLVKGAGADNGQVVHTTWMEGLRRFVGDQFGGGSGTLPPVTEHINTVVTANEYLEHHNLGTHIARDGWYDNDTPKPVFDKNELKLWWGGNHNTGIDTNGNYTFSVKHMMPEGSYHKGLSVDAQELMKEGKLGKLKMLLSLSQGTQAHPVELPINADGTVTIDPHSEIGKIFFSEQGGKAHFLGRFAEVAEHTGTKEATDHMRILATYEGKGIDELKDVITKEVPPIAPSDYLIDPPPIIPIYGRTPLEPLAKKKSVEPITFAPYYYGYDGNKIPSLQEERKLKGRMSETLQTNPDAELDAPTEVKKYFERQSKEYLAEVEALAQKMEPMDPKCKIAVCIPVAGHHEAATIGKTLSSYLNQNLDKKSFEIVLFVNQPDMDRQGNPVKSDGTLEKIQIFKKEHPELNIRVADMIVPRDTVNIGRLRKLLNDATMLRSTGRPDQELVMVSNDADTRGVAPEYLENFVNKFAEHPEIDSLAGQLDWDPEAYIRNPLFHVAARLEHYFILQSRSEGMGLNSQGPNFAFRSSIYAAVDGYTPDIHTGMGEDLDIGARISLARKGVKNRTPVGYAGARVSRLYTSARRGEKAIRDGLAPIEQWFPGFGAFDDEVRKINWAEKSSAPDYNDPEVVKKLVTELEKIINRTLMVEGNWFAQGQRFDTFTRRALGWLGLKYRVTGPHKIEITDASKLIEGLKQYSKDGLEIMERKTGKRKRGGETAPKPPESKGEGVAVPTTEVKIGAAEVGTVPDVVQVETKPPEPKVTGAEVIPPVIVENVSEPEKVDQAPVSATETEGQTTATTPAAEENAQTAPAPIEAPVVEPKTVEKKERKPITIKKVRDILQAELEKNTGVTEVKKMGVDVKGRTLQFNIEILTKGGPATMRGSMVNEKGKIVTKQLNTDANLIIKSRIGRSFSDIGTAVQAYFEKEAGKPVSSIRITPRGLVVEFEPKAEVATEPKRVQA